MAQYGNDLDSTPGVEFHSGLLCAGFVNAHSHIELAYLRGAIAEGGGFAAFAESIGRVRDSYSEEERLFAIAEADVAMWQEGVDAVGDIVNGEISFATKATSKIYYHNFAEVFGLRVCNLERQRELLKYPHTSLSPHSTYSVQDAPFREVCGQACEQPLSIHFLETEDEAKLYCDKNDSQSMIQSLQEASRSLEEYLVIRKKAEYGNFKNWYRGDLKMNVKQRLFATKQLMGQTPNIY